jgi:hypothetical protein
MSVAATGPRRPSPILTQFEKQVEWNPFIKTLLGSCPRCPRCSASLELMESSRDSSVCSAGTWDGDAGTGALHGTERDSGRRRVRLRIRRDCRTVCGGSRCRVARPFRPQAAPWSMIQALREGPDQISRHHASNLYACHRESPFENQSALAGDRRCWQPQSKEFHELRSKLSGFAF